MITDDNTNINELFYVFFFFINCWCLSKINISGVVFVISRTGLLEPSIQKTDRPKD